MLKKVNLFSEEDGFGIYESTMYIGSATEVKALYKSLDRNNKKHWGYWEALYMDFPILVEERTYGLELVERNDQFRTDEGKFFVHGEEMALGLAEEYGVA